MLLMIEKGIKEGICHSICSYENTKNKYMKDFDKNKESSHLQFIYMDGQCHKRCL